MSDIYSPHRLHAADRVWPETNCYFDLWIELLHGLGRDPLPLLGAAVALDWEVDHFTFLKPASTDILAASGIVVHEMALWRETAAQIVAQIDASAVPILEVDAFFLPDTQANAYGHTHTKTTIAIVAIQAERQSLDYLHNASRYCLSGNDYAGVLGLGDHRPMLFPFAELARPVRDPASDEEARALALQWLGRYASTRRCSNPVADFASALPGLLAEAGSDPYRINALCFNTTRQFGSAFGLLADHLAWLGEDMSDADDLARSAKTLQFQLARAARRNVVDPAIDVALETMSARWERCMERLGLLNAVQAQKTA